MFTEIEFYIVKKNTLFKILKNQKILAPRTIVTRITPTHAKSSHLGFITDNTFESIAHLAGDKARSRPY